MAEQVTPTAPAGEQNNEQQEQPKEFEVITSQEDFDKAIQARIARERAKIPTDYDDLKAKASEFEKWQESQKTEAQKQADKLSQIERENAELKAANTRAEVAAAKGVPSSLLSGSTQAELEAAADALIAFKGEQQAPRLHIPGEGNSPTTTGTPATEFADFLTNQLGQ